MEQLALPSSQNSGTRLVVVPSTPAGSTMLILTQEQGMSLRVTYVLVGVGVLGVGFAIGWAVCRSQRRKVARMH